MTSSVPQNPPADRPRHRLSGPAELLRAVPYLLGFHPEDSLVLVGLERGRLVVTARLDLLDSVETELLADTLGALVRGGATELISLIWDGPAAGVPEDLPVPGDPLPWTEVARLVARVADEVRLLPVEQLLISGGRWWSYLCVQPGCCPADGHALPDGPSAFEAAATVEGLVARPNREALVAVLDPVPDAFRQVLVPALEAAERVAAAQVPDGDAERRARSVKRALFAAARTSDAPGWTMPDGVLDWAVALRGIELRDPVWLAIDAGRLDGRPLWLELARRLPSPWDATPLFLYGWASWRAGDGALARIAAQRAVESDARYSAADLLLAALTHGINPHELPRLRGPRPRSAATRRTRRSAAAPPIGRGYSETA